MKVSSTGSVSSTAVAKGARPAAAGAFSVSGPGAAAPATQVSGVASVNSVAALLALQEVGGPLERRRKALGRAGRILDVLEDMKLALLDGTLSTQSIERLARAVRDQRESTDDPALESLLDAIETRAAVELAKREGGKIAA